MPTDFVDRVEDMAELRSLVIGLAEGRGRALVLDSVSGMGKTALLEAFADAARADPGLPECRVISARCHARIGSGLMYGPILDLLLELAQDVRQPGPVRQGLHLARRAAARSAPELLSAMVPGLGAAFSLGREVAQASLASGSMPFDSLLPFQQGVAVQIAEAIWDRARSGPPLVLVIDDVQHIDPSSMLVLDRLLHALPDQPVGVVLSHTTDGAFGDGPGAAVEEMLHHWWSDGLLERRLLTGLPSDAVAELVAMRFPSAPPAFSERLSQLTSGHAVFVRVCLDEWQPDRGVHEPLPASLSRVVERRLRLLCDQDRELLAVAATQGATFLSRTVSHALGFSHDEVMERLRRIAHTHRIIVPAELPAWASREASDCYRFEHRALWGVVYAQQSPEQLRSRHARIAAAMAVDTDEAGETLPLERRLEIAHHLRHGGPRCLSASADAHYALARSAATEGLSFAEAERHCVEAIQAIRELPERDQSRDQRLVRAVELLLSLTEVRWRGQGVAAGDPDIDALAAEAEAAAARCSASELRIRTALQRGKTLLATQGLVPSLAKLREAVELAEEYGDPVVLFVARVEYGRQVSKQRLADGLAQLREAERMYASDPALGGDDPVLQHARNLGEMQLGVTLFDSGHLGEALERLRRCTQRLDGEPLRAELPIGLNYLAQVYMALGDGHQAEQTLRNALAFEEERGGDSGWHAYNTALLARLLAERLEQRATCLQLMERAWAETQRTWLANLVPIVRNLCAEVLLLTADRDPESLARAYQMAVDTIEETRSSGMVRSEIAAQTLRGRVLLRQGDVTGAVGCAREAVRILDDVGDMPALRTEEVLYYCAVVLRAGGLEAEAQMLLGRAREVLDGKASSIPDETARRRFWDEVPANRAIRDGEWIN